MALARWGRGRDFDLALSHNSYSQILAARALSLRVVTLMDYEHQPANHLAFRMASRIIVPRAFPATALSRFGASPSKVRRYDGIKEDVYLADFKADASFETKLSELGISRDDVLVTVRPPAREALYHGFENELFDQLLERLSTTPGVKTLLLPRNEAQRQTYGARASSNLVLPAAPLDGANLISSSDMVVSAGGTMNREAAALGVPAASIFLGEWAAIDEQLVSESRLRRISSADDVRALPLQKKPVAIARRAMEAAAKVADLILEP